MSGAESKPPKEDTPEYWGYLFKPNRSPALKLDQLLRGLAACISRNFEPNGSTDLTPSQLSAFYHSVGGNYDALFVDTPPETIAYIYKSLGCLHSLQPDLDHSDSPEDEAYVTPSVPALKPKGFVHWQAIQLLLGPQEHVPFLQNALQKFEIINPADGQPFPKDLPMEAFPSRPDPQMVAWHSDVTERLRKELENCEIDAQTEKDPGPKPPYDARHNRRQSIAEGAYVEMPPPPRPSVTRHPSRDAESAPAIVRQFAQAAPDKVRQGSKTVANTMRNIASPHLWSKNNNKHHHHRRRSSRSDDNISDDDDARNSQHRRRTTSGSSAHSRPTTSGGHPTSPPYHGRSAVYPDKRTVRSRIVRVPRPREYSTSPTDSDYDRSRSPPRYPGIPPQRRRRVPDPVRGVSEREYLRARDNSRHRRPSPFDSRGRAKGFDPERDPRGSSGPRRPGRSGSPPAMAHWTPYGSPPKTSTSGTHPDGPPERGRDNHPIGGSRPTSGRSGSGLRSADAVSTPNSGQPSGAANESNRGIPRLTRTVPSSDRAVSFETEAARRQSEPLLPGPRPDRRERASRGSHGSHSGAEGGSSSSNAGAGQGMWDGSRAQRRKDGADMASPGDTGTAPRRMTTSGWNASHPPPPPGPSYVPPPRHSSQQASPPPPRVNGVGGRQYPHDVAWRH